EENGCPAYIRAPAVGLADEFVRSLASLTVQALQREGGAAPASAFVCQGFGKCPRTERAHALAG
ncbi:MAG TPA: hypothetical protein VD906_12130, partial [Caulobacteraceae bacterium]|nr:hypothetical protein [Caulobacteraceae bacterium]